MKIIVITGSTRGIGRGLAEAFLERGCAVVVSGRTAAAVERAVAELTARYGAERVLGQPCDVRDFAQVQALWDAVVARFGRVDVWVNNAGLGHAQMVFWELRPEQIAAVVETNIVGAMHGAKVALSGMLTQGFGAFYNLEGLGSSGSRVAGLTLYGSTKRALNYLTDCWAAEVKGTPLVVGAVQPGMIVTDMISGQFEGQPEEWERARRIFNILADRVETAAPWLAERMLANRKNGARFQRVGGFRTMLRFLIAPFRKRDLFGE